MEEHIIKIIIGGMLIPAVCLFLLGKLLDK
jgi:hypothetical protein